MGTTRNTPGKSTRPAPTLALFGAAPAFAEQLHVGRPNIGDRERFLARLNDILDRRWLTNHGGYVIELERRIAGVDRRPPLHHCVANGTIGAGVRSSRALGLTGEVIVPSFTFVATAHALQWQEITPVFCDIDPARTTSTRRAWRQLSRRAPPASSACTSGAGRARSTSWRRSPSGAA